MAATSANNCCIAVLYVNESLLGDNFCGPVAEMKVAPAIEELLLVFARIGSVARTIGGTT